MGYVETEAMAPGSDEAETAPLGLDEVEPAPPGSGMTEPTLWGLDEAMVTPFNHLSGLIVGDH
jgi:hypothetical protein